MTEIGSANFRADIDAFGCLAQVQPPVPRAEERDAAQRVVSATTGTAAAGSLACLGLLNAGNGGLPLLTFSSFSFSQGGPADLSYHQHHQDSGQAWAPQKMDSVSIEGDYEQKEEETAF